MTTPFQRAFQSGYAAAEQDWSEATGFGSLEEARRASERSPLRLGVEFPGRWIVHNGRQRFVRGYRNGRFGYWDIDGAGRRVFVDVDPGDGPAAA